MSDATERPDVEGLRAAAVSPAEQRLAADYIERLEKLRVNTDPAMDDIRHGWDALSQERDRLRAALNRDQTGLAAALNRVRQIVLGWSWIPSGEWGSYEHEEHTVETLRREVGDMIEKAVDECESSLRASGDIADKALRKQDTLRLYPDAEARTAVSPADGRDAAAVKAWGEDCKTPDEHEVTWQRAFNLGWAAAVPAPVSPTEGDRERREKAASDSTSAWMGKLSIGSRRPVESEGYAYLCGFEDGASAEAAHQARTPVGPTEGDPDA